MNPRTHPSPAIEVLPAPDRLASAVAEHVVARAAGAIAAAGRFTLALAGGSTPRAIYSLLAGDGFVRRVEWAQVHVVWGDERCVPPNDARSNYRMAREAFLDRVPIPPDQIHRIRGEEEPHAAASGYERVLRQLLGEDRPGAPAAGLDLVLLGMGEDGHTASLFPGQGAVHETTRWVAAVYVGAAAMWRVTLTPVVINAARNVSFVVSGAGKAERVRQVLEAPYDPALLPSQAIAPSQGRLTWFLDAAAAGRHPPARRRRSDR